MLLAALLAAALVWAVPARAGAERATEAAVKAAFVYNFTKFIEWPAVAFAGAQAPIVLCVSSDTENMVTALSALEGKAAQGRLIAVRTGVPAHQPEGCHALFVGAEGAKAALGAAHSLQGLLTISDARDFASAGGVIGLFAEGDRIRFEINPQAAQRAGLKVSAQLLKLAKVTPNQ
jgi:hypothetical protein